jgi:hypothetical protein
MGRLPWLSLPLLVALPLGLGACARPNPAFDGRERSEGSEGDGDGDADTLGTGNDEGNDESNEEGNDASGDGDGDADSESSGDGDGEPISDVPDEPLCPWQPSPGLAIRVGSPANFGGQCPSLINMTARVIASGGGEVSLSICDSGCEQCGSAMSLAALPLLVPDYIPADPNLCLSVRAETSLGADAGGCYWGSLSVRNWSTQRPFVIATTKSAPPPADTLALVEALVPKPVLAGTCACGQVGFGEGSCCLDATPPEFWYYPVAGQQLFAGDSLEIPLPNTDLSIDFMVFQAERIAGCVNGSGPLLSWALTDVP